MDNIQSRMESQLQQVVEEDRIVKDGIEKENETSIYFQEKGFGV